MDKAYIYHKTTLQSWLIFKDIPGIIFQSCNLDMSSFAYIDKNLNFNINGSYNLFSSVLPGMQNGTRQSTSHWFAIYFHTLWFSLVLTACNLFQLWCFFFIYIYLTKEPQAQWERGDFIFDLQLMIWFVNMLAWGVYCLRQKLWAATWVLTQRGLKHLITARCQWCLCYLIY